MRLTKIQMEEAVVLFEEDIGHSGNDYTQKILAASDLRHIEVAELEQVILDGLNNGLYTNEETRISAYWALSKRYNQELIPAFKKWLKTEIDLKDHNAVYQLLIALDNLEEPVFNADRKGGSGAHETELNFRDGRDYLEKYGIS